MILRRARKGMKIYLFFRKEGWYTIELKDDEDAIHNALCNPGTLRVEDLDGRVVWKEEKKL